MELGTMGRLLLAPDQRTLRQSRLQVGFDSVPMRRTVHKEIRSLGTAVYVMSITISVSSFEHIESLIKSEQTFQINGTDVGSFSKTASVGLETKYDYNVPVFVHEGLPLGRHVLTILNNGATSGQRSAFLLDRIIYTSVDHLEFVQATN